ncbi:MAG: PAS domain-containing hybrid sensor histidine kinase/response regulator [Sulfuricaulis sp.]
MSIPLIIFIGGVLVCLLFASWKWWQTRARMVAAEQAAQVLRESVRKLNKQREWLQAAFNSMGEAIITTDNAGIVTFLNPVAVSLTGWTLSNAQGASLPNVFRIINEKNRDVAENPITRVLRDVRMINGTNHIALIAKDGTERPIEECVTPIHDKQGNVDGFVLIFRDVTNQRRTQQALEKSEAHYRSLIEISPQGVWMTDLNGVLLFINLHWIEYGGISLEQSVGQRWMEQTHPDDQKRVHESWQNALNTGSFYEVEARFLSAAKNEYRWHLVRGLPVHNSSGQIEKWLGVVVDIHRRMLAEEAMAQLVAIVESSDDAIIGMSLDGIVTSWNAGAERLYGYTAAEMIGKPISILAPPGYIDEVLAFLEGSKHGDDVLYYETKRLRKDNQILDVSLTISPIKNNSGRVIGVSKIARDISERKRAEQQRTQLLAQEQALRTQSETANRAKDNFLATLSHELRTPLNAVLGWVQTLDLAHDNKETLARAVEAINQSAQTQARLIDDLLDVSDIVAGKLRLDVKPMSLAAVINNAIESLQPSMTAKEIQFTAQYDPEAESFHGDAARIQQIIWNLVANAVKFTSYRGNIRVVLNRHPSHVKITVEDDGVGISATFLPYVFHRFRQADSSSRRRHGGLGLGLAIVRHLVELHDGTVEAESLGIGHGARFTVRLPVRTPTANKQMEPASLATNTVSISSSSVPRLNGISILSVDDDRNTREMLQAALQRAGAKVFSGSSAAEALTLLQRHKPDVLISDIGLPEEDGYDLLRAVRALPFEAGGATPAIALTGYVTAQDRAATMLEGYQAFISKPVNLNQLINTLIQVTQGLLRPMTEENTRKN